jgi:thiol-disulfide isomerase/thioredoxin
MKASLFILTLLLAISMILVSCQPSVDSGNDGEIRDNDSASVGDNPDNSINDKEDDATIPEDNEYIGENDSDIPKNEENSDSGEEKDENTTPLPEIGTKVGNRFADVTLTTMDGGSLNTADLRGKIVILNLWASWCPPCKAELPDFDRIATEYKDQVVIVAADVDAGKGGAYSYVQQNFPESDIIFAYDTVYGTAYSLAGGNGYVPYTAIMDQNGVIVYSDSGMLSHTVLVNIIEGLLN